VSLCRNVVTPRQGVQLQQRGATFIPVLSLFSPGAQGGQNVVEYGLLIALIVIVVLVAINAFGQEIEPWFATLAGRVTTTGT
jgi:Flp pilus assembly pilin Flp